MRELVGNFLQIRGAERYILQDGKGCGMHFLSVRNGLGLDVWISIDRCGDISRISYNGKNMGYFSPCGYVAPAFYDKESNGFLKSFTAGFFTTCGLSAVGAPCEDCGEQLPMHGTVSNIPAELYCVEEDNDGLTVKLKVSDAVIFGRKLILKRTYRFSYTENKISLSDTVTNEGDATSPFMIMYHCNMGYPLLSENSKVMIPHSVVKARDKRAQSRIDSALNMEKPQAGYEECCYYYDVTENNGNARVGIYNEDINSGVVLSYDKTALPCFTEWKMMGKIDYVLGLEPGNCTPDGRDVMRESGKLEFLSPNESKTTSLTFNFTNSIESFNKSFI